MSTKVTFPLHTPHNTTSVIPEVKLSDVSSNATSSGCGDVDQESNSSENYPVSRLWNATPSPGEIEDVEPQTGRGEKNTPADTQDARVEDVTVQNPETEGERSKDEPGKDSMENRGTLLANQDSETAHSNVPDTETEAHKTPARKKSNRLITAFGSLGRFLIILAVTTFIFTPLPWILARIVTGEFIAEFALVSFLFALGAGMPVAFFIFVVSFVRNKPLVQFYDDEVNA